jgi:hypothetical protein
VVKTAIFASVLLASAAAAAPPAKHAAPRAATRPAAPVVPALPVFEFKGMRPDVPVDMAQLTSCTEKDGETRCSGTDSVVAGIKTYISPSVYLVNGKLSTLIYVFENGGTETITLLQALTEKYGRPCKNETEKWTNKAGTSFDNPVWTWCFRTGKLKLHTMSFQRDYSDIWYTDEVNKPPPTPAKVDF